MNGRPILVDLLLDTITLFMIMIMIELASGSTGKHRPSYSLVDLEKASSSHV